MKQFAVDIYLTGHYVTHIEAKNKEEAEMLAKAMLSTHHFDNQLKDVKEKVCCVREEVTYQGLI